MTIASVQIGGKAFNAASTTIAYGSNVVSGNTLIVYVATYDTGNAPAQPVVTKSSGTATIGTPVFDKELTPAFDAGSRISIIRIPITGSGSLTLSINTTNGDFNNVGIQEVSSASAILLDGTPVSNTGTSATESTGNVVTAGPAFIAVLGTEGSSGDFTYTLSDTEVFKDSTGSANATCNAQCKSVGSASTYTVTAGTGNSWPWAMIAVAYKETTVTSGGYTDQPRRDMVVQQRQAA